MALPSGSRGRSQPDWRVAGLAACLALLWAGSPTARAESLPLTFDEEFNNFVSSPDGSVGWMTSFPGENRSLWSNDDAEWYSDSSVGVNPFSLKNGKLSIAAALAGPGAAPDGLLYTSGIITTYLSFAQLYGVFAVRAQLPAGQGLWPAFWMLPASNQYTSELDVFEVLGQAPTTAYVSVHGANKQGVWGADIQAVQTVDTSASFHIYAVDWGPHNTSFFIDGKQVATAPTPASMNTPMYMILNLAVGGQWSWPGSPNASTKFPAIMKIDWVRAYATKNTVSVSGSAAIVPARLK